MNVKKLLTLTVVGFASSGALASKTMLYTAPAPNMDRSVGVYVEGLLGYNRYAIADVTRSTSQVVDSSITWDNGTGNWAFGADIGYQFYQYFSAELGGIHSLESKISFTETNGNAFDGLSARPWYAYLVSGRKLNYL